MAAKKPGTKSTRAPRKKQEYWVRNLRNVHVSLKGDDRRIELAPRGQRRDAVQLKKGEKEELTDVGVLCEIITANEAKKVQEKQTTNEQQRSHPAWDHVRNEKGEKYEQQDIRIEEEYNKEQGEKVADLKDGNVIIDRGVGIRRAIVPGTEDKALPKIPDSVPPEEQADWLARQKHVEGPAAGLGDVRIVQEEPQIQEEE